MTTTIQAGAVNTGPIVGLTASNPTYGNQIFSVFTDFGTPSGGGIPARPGFSGVQGSGRRPACHRGRPLINHDLQRPPAPSAGSGATSSVTGPDPCGHDALPAVLRDRLRPVRLFLADRAAVGRPRPRPPAARRSPSAAARRTTPAACSSATWPAGFISRSRRWPRCRPRPSSCRSRGRVSSA